MSTRNFVVKNGLTVGNVTIDAASGNLVANSVQAGNIRTNNLLYANGSPWDLQEAAGSNTQVQYNDGTNNFGASANFTFNSATNTLGVTGNANVSGAVNTANINSGTASLAITANGSTTNFYANGVTAFSGNVSAPNFIGNVVGNISGNIVIPGSNTGVVFNDGGNANTSSAFTFNKSSNLVTIGGNLTTDNANLGNLATANYISGTLTTAAQPNITSVGTLSSLDVSGNASAGNLSTGGDLSVTGNASANNLSTTNKVTAGNGLQVTTGALSVLAGNLDVTGNLNVTGNVNYSNVTDLVVGDPLIYLGANNTGDTYDLGIVGSYNQGTYYHTGIARNAADDYWTFFDGVVAEPTTVIDWANAIYPTVKMGNLITTANANIAGTLSVTGNANVGNIGATNAVFTNVSGNGANLSSITGSNVTGEVAYANVANNVAGANVSGQVGNALVAGTVYGNTQSNITSVGTLTSLTVSGTSNVANLNASGAIAANGNITGDYILGNGAFLTGIDATSIQNGTANVRTFNNGNVTISAAGNANIVVVTGTGANVDGYLAVTGNVSGNVFSGNGSGLSAIAGANVTGTVANATYAVSAGTAGTVTTAAQPNITSVGTLTSLSVTGNVSAGNVDGGNLVSANYVSGTLTTAAQPNITSVGSLTSLDVNGNVTANYVSTVGFSSDRANVSVSSGTVIDQFSPSTFRTAKYVISASGDDGYQSVETLLVHDGVDAYITIYGSICSNIAADIIDVSANINGVSGNVALYATAGGANVVVNVVASYIKT